MKVFGRMNESKILWHCPLFACLWCYEHKRVHTFESEIYFLVSFVGLIFFFFASIWLSTHIFCFGKFHDIIKVYSLPDHKIIQTLVLPINLPVFVYSQVRKPELASEVMAFRDYLLSSTVSDTLDVWELKGI